MRYAGIWLVIALVAQAWGCDKKGETPDNPKPKQIASAVARIGFLDQEQCCKCTRERTEKSWAALQVALGNRSVPVERVHVDSQESRADPYRLLRPFQVVPAIYFLNDKGKLIEMLQGEVSEEAIRKLLQ